MGEWTIEEKEILKQNYNQIPMPELMVLLPGRSESDIRAKAFSLGLTKKQKKWTLEEEEILRKYYLIETMEQLMEKLPGRTADNIRSKARRMGLTGKIKPWTLEEDERIKQNYLAMKPNELIKLFPGRTVEALSTRLNSLGLSHFKAEWSEEDVEKLIHYFPTDTQKQIMERFPTRSYKAICDKADELGLIRENKKSKWAIEEDEIIIKYSSEIDILELAKKLPNRTPVAIEARIRKLVGGKKEIKAKVGEKLEKEVSQIQQEVKEKEIVVCENNTLVEEVIIENKVEETPAVITGQTVEGIPTEELPLIEDFSPEEIEVFEEKKEKVVEGNNQIDDSKRASSKKNEKKVNKSKNKKQNSTPRKKAIWTEDEDRIVKNYFLIETIEEIIKRLPNHTKQEIVARAKKLNVIGINSKPANWKIEDIETLKEYYPIEGTYAHNRLRKYSYNSFKSAVKQLGLKGNRHNEPWTLEEDYLACEFYLNHIDDWSKKETIEELYNIFVSKGFVNHGRKTIHMKLANCAYIHKGEGLEHASIQNIKVYNKLTGGNLFTRFFRWLRRIFKI